MVQRVFSFSPSLTCRCSVANKGRAKIRLFSIKPKVVVRFHKISPIKMMMTMITTTVMTRSFSHRPALWKTVKLSSVSSALDKLFSPSRRHFLEQ